MAGRKPYREPYGLQEESGFVAARQGIVFRR